MSLLTPLGLLGLIGVVALIIIYIIKPNYQNKFIPSTFIWKLSLKYKKKKIPISKLRSILLFICQLLIIVATTFILAQPFINNELESENGDTIIVIDTSASMHTIAGYSNRLARAVDAARLDADKALENGNKITIIVAGEEARFLVQQAGEEQATLIDDAFAILRDDAESLYTYGNPDIEGAMGLAEQITAFTDNVTVTLYTDTFYVNKGDVQVRNFGETAEWNAAILDVRTSIIENYYRIEIDVVSYGADQNVPVYCEIFEPNGSEGSIELYENVTCQNDEITTIVYGLPNDNMSDDERDLITEEIALTSYNYIYVHASAYDSLDYDNQFYLYGGKKPVIDVYYCSAMPNNYVTSALLVIEDAMKGSFDINITEAKKDEMLIEGYDIYFYEHVMPQTLPTDGLVFCINPVSLPGNAGIKFGSTATSVDGQQIFLSAGDSHPIMQNVDATQISVTQFTSVTSYDAYTPIVTLGGSIPLLLVRDDMDAPMVVMPFSLHYSNLALLPEFPMIIKNTISHFFPETLDHNVYETYQEIDINSRGNQAEVTAPTPSLDKTLEELPAKYTATIYGIYTITHPDISGEPVRDYVYVHIPSSESDINHEESNLVNPYFYSDGDANNIDLLFYFALAAVALLFFEWWLKSREQI